MLDLSVRPYAPVDHYSLSEQLTKTIGNGMNLILNRAAIALIAFVASTAFGDDAVEKLKRDVTNILRGEFPNVKLTFDETRGSYEFAVKMRTFVTYSPDKLGNWQDATETLAPDRAGFFVRFYVADGPWQGALSVPHTGTTDRYIFKSTFVISDTTSGKRHIHALIMTPRIDASKKTKEGLFKLFVRFAKEN